MLPHEAWFTDVEAPYDTGFLGHPATIFAIAAALAAAIVWRLGARALPRPELPSSHPWVGSRLARTTTWWPRRAASGSEVARAGP